MIIKIGTDEDKKWILTQYPYTSSVIGQGAVWWSHVKRMKY